MKNNNQNSFLNILKSTTIFGSTQIFQLIIMLLKSKVSAILLGPLGMGIYTIFQTTVLTISQISSLGIFQSGIKEISAYNNPEDKEKQEIKIELFSKLSQILSFVALLLMIALSYPLSKFNFGDNRYFISFCLLGFAGIFYILSHKQLTILQATRQTKKIAIYSLLSAVFSLLISFIFYKAFGIKGIVPTIIFSFGAQYFVGYFLTKQYRYKSRYFIKTIFKKNKSLLSLGIVLMISGLLINVYTLILNAFISNKGRVEDLGLFNAAFSITNGVILVLITVLSSDYYPRLSSFVNNPKETALIVNQQTELMSLITAPLSIFMITFSSFVVKLLLSSEFLVIIPMLKLMSIGLLFRIIWQSMSYIILSRGDKKIYFIFDALIGNGLVFLCNIIFYIIYGLEGLGYSFVISSLIIAVILVIVVKNKYEICFNTKFISTYIVCFGLSLGAYLLSLSYDSILILLPVLLISILFSIYIILKRGEIDLKIIIKKKLKL